MPNEIRIKRRLAGNAAGAPASLKTGELAWNQQDNIIYGGFGDGGSGTATSVVAVAGSGAFAVLASPAFTDTPTGPTATVNTNTTQLATTAFVLGQGNATAATIAMNGTQAAGTSNLYARADHVHPSDTSRAPLASPTFTGTPLSTTAAVDTNSTQIATTAFVVGQASGTNPVMDGTATIGTSLRFARADHVHPSDTTKANLASPTFTGTPLSTTAAVDTNTTQIATTAFVIAQAAAATPAALGTAAVGTATRFARADHVHAMPNHSQVGAPTADVAWGSFKLTSLADPVNAQDAATKNYVDSVAQGLDAKPSVRVATTANITLSATQTIDGISVVAGDRVLVKNQTTTNQNGIYVVAAGAWSRAVDMSIWAEVPNAFCFVEQGTTQADTSWVCTADQGGTIGTDAIAFVQFGAAGTYLAGTGLTLTGNTFDVVGTANRIVANADSIDIASNYVGQTSITTLGTIATGVWNGTTIAVANGGTGATTLTGLVKGNGTSAFTAAVVGTDYLDPSSAIDGGTF